MRACSGFHISHWDVVTQSFPQCQVAVCSELVWGGLWLNLKCRESGIVWTLEIVNPASIGPSTTTWWQDVISKSKRKSSAFLVRLRPDLWSVIGDAFHVPAFVFVAFLLIGSAQREKTWRKIKLFASEDPGARNQKTKSRSHNWFLNPNSITIHHQCTKDIERLWRSAIQSFEFEVLKASGTTALCGRAESAFHSDCAIERAPCQCCFCKHLNSESPDGAEIEWTTVRVGKDLGLALQSMMLFLFAPFCNLRWTEDTDGSPHPK